MNTSTLHSKVENAQLELDQLLSDGEDTLEARRKLRDAQTELNMAQEKESQVIAENNSKQQALRQQEATKMTRAAIDDLNSDLKKLTHFETPLARLPISFAENLLIARNNLSIAQQSKNAYQSRIDQLHKRQNDLKAKRDEIIQRRTAGMGDDDIDAKSLALIEADQDGLTQLIERETSNNSQSTGTEERAVINAQVAWNNAINTERIRCLRELVSHLESSLITAANALAITPGVKTTDRYQPSQVLRKAAQSGVL